MNSFTYKGYIIQAQIVCYTIRWFVHGPGFGFDHYETLDDAEHAIELYLAKKYINDMLLVMSRHAGVSQDVMSQALTEMFSKQKSS